jgi:acetylornithine deacetylase/succinyl-diaminopimelate desuccinylase-like protein
MEQRVEALRRAVAARRSEMTDFVAELISVATENPPGCAYEKALRVAAREIEKLGQPVRIEAVPGGRELEHPRYWLSSEWGEGERAVYFHGHIDVVPAQDPSQFVPRITEDTLFGRGSSDMKGGLASMIYAMRALADTSLPPKGRIALRIVPDEETGGKLGSEALGRAGLLFERDARAMLTAEPTGGVLWHASRGALTYRLRVRGRPSHVGLQFRGSNAFEKALPLLQSLRTIKEDVERRVTSFPLDPEPARHSILMMGGEVSGEQNFNLVPSSFVFTLDRRLNPEEDFEAEKRRLLEAFESARSQGLDLEVECIQEARPAGGISSESPDVRAIVESIEAVKGERPRVELCPGILEIRFYAEKGVPAFAYGPGLLSVSHGPNEFVKRRELEDCAVIYALAALRLLG